MSTNSTAVINIRINQKTKLQAMKVAEKIGLDVSSAIKMFLNKFIETESIPFRVGVMNVPGAAAAARKEVEWAEKYGKKYSSAKEMFDDILR